VVAALLLAADATGAAGQVINVAQGRPTSVLELIEQLGRVLQLTPDVVLRPARAGDIRDSCADLERARTLLGFEPRVSLEEGLRRVADYYRQTLAE
jgi:nucleoside-diphosphate-sugar epimerase